MQTAQQKHLVAAAQGTTHLPREGAQGARMNSHASDLVAKTKGAAGLTETTRYKPPGY